jgi:Spy/CpxP family protein refolding chaperone
LRLAAASNRGASTHRTSLSITFLHGNNWKNMSNFQIWEQQNLARFAQEANQKLMEQQKEIEQLRDDLRIAIEAYRKLIKGTP